MIRTVDIRREKVDTGTSPDEDDTLAGDTANFAPPKEHTETPPFQPELFPCQRYSVHP